MEISYVEFQDGFEIRKTPGSRGASFDTLPPYLRKADGWTRAQAEQALTLLDEVEEFYMEEAIALLNTAEKSLPALKE